MNWKWRKWSVTDSRTSSMMSCDNMENPHFVFTLCDEENMHRNYLVSLKAIEEEHSIDNAATSNSKTAGKPEDATVSEKEMDSLKGHNIIVNIEKSENEENRRSDCDIPKIEIRDIQMEEDENATTPYPVKESTSPICNASETSLSSPKDDGPFSFCNGHLSAPSSPVGTGNRDNGFNNFLDLPRSGSFTNASPRLLRRVLSVRDLGSSTPRLRKFTTSQSAANDFSGDSISCINVPASQDPPKKRNPKKDSLSVLMSSIYAVFIVMLGAIIFLNDQQRSHRLLSEVFSSVLAGVGLIWLILLHVDISLYKREVLKELKQREDEINEAAERMSIATAVIINSQYQYATANDPEKNKVPPYRFLLGRHSGSFYLKVGSAAFCFGYLIYQGLELGQHILNYAEKREYNCYNISSIVIHVISPIYAFYQLFITFKYSNIVINRNKVMARFGIMHLIATCLCSWFSTILDEALEDFAHKSTNYSGSTTDSEFDVANFHITIKRKENWIYPHHCIADSALSTRSMSAIPYLYPFAIEYNFLIAGVWFIVWQNIGKEHSNADPHHIRHTISQDEGGSDEIAYESNLVIHADCHSANKGLFIGIFLLFIIIVTVIVFFVAITTKGYEKEAITIHTFQEGILTLIGLLGVCVAFYQIRKLDHSEHPITFLDDVLLFIPLPFYFVHGIMSVIAEFANENYLRLGIHVLVTVQVIVQTPFIIDGLRRCSQSQSLRYQKPGREMITFLIVLNLIMWIVNTFELKSVERYEGQEEYFGDLIWMFIGHTTLPLILFYRFHSSVCLADMWKSAYEKEI